MNDVLLAQRENIATSIYRHIKRELMVGEHEPGAPMLLRALVERMGVSQTPVREALLQLVSERVLDMKRGRTIRVPVFDLKRLQDLRAIRLKLEVMAAVQATPVIGDETIEQLDATHRAMMVCKRDQDAAGTLRRNFEFHSTLYASCGMPDLIAIIETLWAQTGPSLIYLYRKPFVELGIEHPHEEVLRGLRDRDAGRVAKAIERDIEGYGKALLQRLPQEDSV